jgi:hypothetical protein
VSRPALGPTQPPVQWLPGVLSTGVKARPGRDADHSPPSSAEIVNEKELYLSPQAPPWRVEGLLYLLTYVIMTTGNDLEASFAEHPADLPFVFFLLTVKSNESERKHRF